MLNPRSGLHDISHIVPDKIVVARFEPAHVDHHIKHRGPARDRFNGFGDFGLRRVTTQRKPDRNADSNRRARDSGHRFIYIAGWDKNHGESMFLRFLAQP